MLCEWEADKTHGVYDAVWPERLRLPQTASSSLLHDAAAADYAVVSFGPDRRRTEKAIPPAQHTHTTELCYLDRDSNIFHMHQGGFVVLNKAGKKHLFSNCKRKCLLLSTLFHWLPVWILSDILWLFDQRHRIHTFHRDNVECIQVLKRADV